MEDKFYVARDAGGSIVALFANPQPQADGSFLTDPEPLPASHQDVLAFFENLQSRLQGES